MKNQKNGEQQFLFSSKLDCDGLAIKGMAGKYIYRVYAPSEGIDGNDLICWFQSGKNIVEIIRVI
jgi:hypothetical protein